MYSDCRGQQTDINYTGWNIQHKRQIQNWMFTAGVTLVKWGCSVSEIMFFLFSSIKFLSFVHTSTKIMPTSFSQKLQLTSQLPSHIPRYTLYILSFFLHKVSFIINTFFQLCFSRNVPVVQNSLLKRGALHTRCVSGCRCQKYIVLVVRHSRGQKCKFRALNGNCGD